jgi:hypothetical protein
MFEDGFSSQHGDRVWGIYYEEQRPIVRFCSKRTQCKGIYKDMFPVYRGSVCRVKRFTTGSRNLSKMLGSPRWWNGGAELAETTVKILLCCGFWRSGKAMGQLVLVLVEDMPRNKCFFPCSNITCFTFYIHLWSKYWFSLVRIYRNQTSWHRSVVTQRQYKDAFDPEYVTELNFLGCNAV